MYVRPMAFSSTGSLGIAAPSRTTLMVILSPAGPYFETGAPAAALAISLWHLRALAHTPLRDRRARRGVKWQPSRAEASSRPRAPHAPSGQAC